MESESSLERGKAERRGEESLCRLLPSVGDAIFQPMSRDVTNRRRESWARKPRPQGEALSPACNPDSFPRPIDPNLHVPAPMD